MKQQLHEIIFEADTRPGRWFDILLIISIVLSIIVVMLDSVEVISIQHGLLFHRLEWFFTILFSIEYLLRIYSIGKPLRYVTSFYGIVDLLSILPTYLSLLLPGTKFLLTIRVLRILRIFRVLKLVRFLNAADLLWGALRSSGRKIFVFLFTVMTLVVIFGSLMYIIESPESGFTSIPRSVYWAIVTLTTVGYGDISPVTSIGQAVAAVIMILGYAIIAVPTGIVTVELSQATASRKISTQSCPQCSAEGHEPDAQYCRICGCKL